VLRQVRALDPAGQKVAITLHLDRGLSDTGLDICAWIYSRDWELGPGEGIEDVDGGGETIYGHDPVLRHDVLEILIEIRNEGGPKDYELVEYLVQEDEDFLSCIRRYLDSKREEVLQLLKGEVGRSKEKLQRLEVRLVSVEGQHKGLTDINEILGIPTT
jgi:hypothetical protein